MRNSFKSKISYFFRETFRPHSKEEYGNVFSAEKEGDLRKFPWLYIRAFAVLFMLFALSVLTYRITRYSVAFITSVVFGGVMVNIPLMLFFYELFPRKEIKFLTLFCIVVICGVVVSAVTLFGYEFIYGGHANPWISYLWTGFWEELVKGVCAVSVIVILKKKDPLTCFLIGFAVGTGYSLFEDLGYIYSYSRSGSSGIGSSGWLVLMSVGRGFSCVFSHASWTGVICWAYAKFKKPLLNWRFYGVTLGSMVLHYLADVPFFADEVAFLKGFNWGWAIEAFVVIAIAAELYLMLSNSIKECGEKFFIYEKKLEAYEKLSQAGNITAVVCALVLSVSTLAGCAVQTGYVNKQVYFSSDGEFVSFMHNNMQLDTNLQREYDEEKENYSAFYEDGMLLSAAQKENIDGRDYYYIYRFSEDKWELETVGVKIEGRVYYLKRIIIFEDYYFTDYGYPTMYNPVKEELQTEEIEDEPDGGEDNEETPEEETPVIPQPVNIVSFYSVNENALRYGYSTDLKQFFTYSEEQDFKGLGAVIAFSVISSVSLAVGTAATAILKIKARRNKNGQLHILQDN